LQNVIRVFDEQQASKPRTMTKSKGGNGNVTTVTVKSKAGKKSSGSSKKEYDIPEPPAEIKVINYITKQEEFQSMFIIFSCVYACKMVDINFLFVCVM
jgi:hypothetical protein